MTTNHTKIYTYKVLERHLSSTLN
uniref:Uncharacterized protein n=1 Tax=Rhizophora mucronata TaxID=61149 RepID=A0A2P2QK06_RHIMU